MNSKPKISNRRKSSITELKFAIKKYEKKVKNLQQSRNSRSPSVKKSKTHSKSRSLLIDSSQNQIYSRPDISSTNIEYGLKSPELYYLEEDLKNLRSENFELKQKLSSIKKDYDMLIIQIRNQLEQDKQIEIANLTKFYIGKISACEERIEDKYKDMIKMHEGLIRDECRRTYEKKIKKMLEDQTNGTIEHFLKTGKDARGRSMENSLDIDYKVKLVLDTKTAEFERKIQTNNQELTKIRKENESLRGKIIELQAKLDTAAFVSVDRDICGNNISTKYHDLLQEYNSLKHELAQKGNTHFCSKCKAFLDTNNEVSRKMLRIREFLSN